MLRLSLLIILFVVFIYFLLSQIIWYHDIAEILLKLALITNQSIRNYMMCIGQYVAKCTDNFN